MAKNKNEQKEESGAKKHILENAEKEHKERNKKIIAEYKAEKKRIKMLKRLPYKILNTISILSSMFLIILFFFILDVGIEVTAVILLGAFTITYFVIGLLMLAVFYMISENKQRQTLLKLEEEKKYQLAKEKMRAEMAIKQRLEKERRKYEREERKAEEFTRKMNSVKSEAYENTLKTPSVSSNTDNKEKDNSLMNTMGVPDTAYDISFDIAETKRNIVKQAKEKQTTLNSSKSEVSEKTVAMFKQMVKDD